MLSQVSAAFATFISNPNNAAQVAAIITASIGLVSGLVSAFVGFGVNGWLQRNADNRKFELDRKREREKLEQEKAVVRATLSAELASVIRTYQGEIEFVEDRSGFPLTWVPIGFFDALKDGHMNIGLLHPDEVRSAMDAYYSYRTRIGYIARNGSGPVQNDTIPYALTSPQREFLLSDLKEIVEAAEQALWTLDTQHRT